MYMFRLVRLNNSRCTTESYEQEINSQQIVTSNYIQLQCKCFRVNELVLRIMHECMDNLPDMILSVNFPLL